MEFLRNFNEEYLKLGIDLTDSWILCWHYSDKDFIFEIEFSLWPENPHYETPKPGDWTCYKKGQLIFTSATVEKLSDSKHALHQPSIDVLLLLSKNTYFLTFEDVEFEIHASDMEIKIS